MPGTPTGLEDKASLLESKPRCLPALIVNGDRQAGHGRSINGKPQALTVTGRVRAGFVKVCRLSRK